VAWSGPLSSSYHVKHKCTNGAHVPYSSLSSKKTGKESDCKSNIVKITSQWSALLTVAYRYTVFLPEREDLSTPLLLCPGKIFKSKETKMHFPCYGIFSAIW
jgi:hypothetical protein